ncbi:MAG: Hsp70 family protein, partial [Candidatus Omnitrophica bacterium]|nr:Hsp70 family protein [Candidatus Omnitrophota bacterium]
KDAEKFAAEDSKKKEEIEVINQADAMVYSTEKSLKEFGDKVSQGERADIEVRINDLKSALKDKNVDRIKKSMEELNKASHKLAEEIYKQAAQKQQQGQKGQEAKEEKPAEEPKEKNKEDIIDAEYKEEDGSK